MEARNRSNALRERLVHLGIDELRQNGLGAVSIRAVAARAGVSHAAPGYVFGDRAGLLTAMAVRGFELLRDHLAGDADSESSAAPTMVEVGLRYLEFARQDPEVYRLLFATDEIRRDEPEVAAAGAAAFDVLVNALPHTATTPPHGLAPVVAWAIVHGLAGLEQAGALERPYAETVGRDAAVRSLIEWTATAIDADQYDR